MRNFYMFTIMVILIMIMALVMPIACSAAEAVGGDSLGDAIKNLVDGTIIPLFVALIGTFVSIVLAKLKKRLNIQISAETEALIQKQAESAVQMVAEIASKKIKYENVHLTGDAKLDMAIGDLLSKVPRLSKEQADAYIHAALARIRGQGATGEQALVSG